jgi:hypothetical protein
MIYYFGTELSNAGHYFWELDRNDIYRGRHRFEDLPFNPEALPVKKKGESYLNGTVGFYHLGHYSICAIEGSPKDTRPRSKSVFFWDVFLDQQKMIQAIKETPIAMRIINQMPFPVEIFKPVQS